MEIIFVTYGNYVFLIGICLLIESIVGVFSLRKEKKVNPCERKYSIREQMYWLFKLILIIICLGGWGKYNLSGNDFFQLFTSLVSVILQILPFVFSTVIIFVLYVKKRKTKKENIESEYVIKTEGFLFGLFLFFSIVCAGLTIYSINVHEALWVIIILLFFFFAMVFATLNVGLWKIVVRNNEIEYTTTFGLKRKYNFNQIEKAVYKKSGALRIYSKGKVIFTFDDNMDFRMFIKSLELHHIPIWRYDEYQRFQNKQK